MAPSTSANATGASIVVAALMLATSIPSTNAFVPGPSLTCPPKIPFTNDILSPASTTTALSAIRRGGGRRQPRKMAEVAPPMNAEIKFAEMRVSVPTKEGKDEALGVMSKQAALAKAQELGGLDLLLVNANSDPPVCKIVDYSKYRYAQEKKRKEKAKNSKATEVKEVKMSYKIGGHDYDVRLKAATKFIKQGNRVRATVTFRGREVQHDNLGLELLKKLSLDLEDICNMEGKPRREGRNMSAILTPRAEVVKSINDAKRMKEREKKKKKEESLAKRVLEQEAKTSAAKAAMDQEKTTIGGVLDGLDLEDDFDDDDDMDASLDELLGSTKVADDLFA
mmetsp:Transcript_25620/g.53499  ORF Transcript_25620/g.53499 Transcript_25620/m.53499 type:complete len:337 (+) Transcript_25620:106-1116(+)